MPADKPGAEADGSGPLPAGLTGALAAVRSVGAITGAGVSVESGLPTYRGRGGVYDDPEEGERTVRDLSSEALYRTPERTWQRLAALARGAAASRPNAAHEALVRIEQVAERFVLLTQNVDRLHHQAGSRNVIDIHGDLTATVCIGCGLAGRMSAVLHLEQPPSCAACGKLVRPDVVLFGEMLDPHKLRRLQEELLDDPPDLVLVAGTTALFPYIVQPVQRAALLGRITIEINPEATLLSGLVDHSLRGPAGLLLPQIARALGA